MTDAAAANPSPLVGESLPRTGSGVAGQGPAGGGRAEGAEPPVPDWVGDFINRRAIVENELREMAAGKRPLPTAEDCRRLADTLGIPSPYLRPYPPLAARPDPKEWR